ncbi:MAG: hypothetical protein QOE05_2830 [Actinomycetota bacterium]|jgi:hypothetical protein|nr:hypothetical protein [Actinomycetota bacterium]
MLVFGGGAALVLVVGFFACQADKKRRALLQAYALSNGWTYVPRDDSWCGRFDGSPFGQGDNRKATNILTGTYEGAPMVAFDYSYETSSTDSKGHRSKTTHRYAVCALRLPAWLPGLELSPESALTRLAGHLGLGDVELESEDFNRQYRVHAANPKFAYDVLNPRTMAALLARPALHLRLAGVDALSWESGRLVPADLLARLSTLQLLVAGIPSFVWADHAPSADQPGAPA